MDPEHKSQSVSEVRDPRVEKTRALISSAFVLLLGRRNYVRIRVSDITKKAGVGRATFYAHFASKDELLRDELIRVVHPMLVPLLDEACLVNCTALFAHIQHARGIYQSLMAGDSRLVAGPIVQDAIETRIEQILARASGQRPCVSVPGTLVTRFVASTLLGLVSWSLEQPNATRPDQLQAIYNHLVGSALSAYAPLRTEPTPVAADPVTAPPK